MVMKLENMYQMENSPEGHLKVDLEAEFSSLALDIIGLGVFNYDFGSVTKESPIIKFHVSGSSIVTSKLSMIVLMSSFAMQKKQGKKTCTSKEGEWVHEQWIVQDKQWDIFGCINRIGADREACGGGKQQIISNEFKRETDVEKLQQRDYSTLKDASLLRFFDDMRGEDVDDRQLRDDLMTMLIAGHETTAAVLTWAVFLLAQNYYSWTNRNHRYAWCLQKMYHYLLK
ncbi:cytochrome P450 97B3, chloroplastic-like isoform X4 [Amborella trichopoda]|uniref:cytochrome P450 97B3, chloroplastic-like isoform X4 n=1 Tax=Amborella trichopoda TaxID=13333 RepID=UPI0009BD501A|nr:cytochrome P450 97B3, chloroplastic-like isoform X4 [Amborella trichopoda]|eukprot:XP_020518082.1 cytochrome P450 97B3, chloroplastic-like isoform X4 [Amborella trichopoda]